MKRQSISMPVPPSLNNMYSGRRFATDEYKAWKLEAYLVVATQKPEQLFGRVKVEITVPRQRGDIDSRVKPILDTLRRSGVLKNDKQVEEVTVRWSDEGEKTTVIVQETGSFECKKMSSNSESKKATKAKVLVPSLKTSKLKKASWPASSRSPISSKGSKP